MSNKIEPETEELLAAATTKATKCIKEAFDTMLQFYRSQTLEKTIYTDADAVLLVLLGSMNVAMRLALQASPDYMVENHFAAVFDQAMKELEIIEIPTQLSKELMN